jgi:hypothetical protein
MISDEPDDKLEDFAGKRLHFGISELSGCHTRNVSLAPRSKPGRRRQYQQQAHPKSQHPVDQWKFIGKCWINSGLRVGISIASINATCQNNISNELGHQLLDTVALSQNPALKAMCLSQIRFNWNKSDLHWSWLPHGRGAGQGSLHYCSFHRCQVPTRPA